MAGSSLAFVRKFEEPKLAPPPNTVGAMAWIRANLFSSAFNSALTLVGLLLIVWTLPPIIEWAFVNAAWNGSDREACVAASGGACWAFVKAKFVQFMVGRFTIDERWRVAVVAILLVAGLIPMAIPRVPFKRENIIYLLIVFPIVSYILLTGGLFGLPVVETPQWGGLLITLVVSIVGIVVSVPLGIILALGRRSKLPVVRMCSVGFIEFVRGVPLITVLFMASVMLPLFLPAGVNFDKLLRALIGVALFSAAYMAEVVRGGLQAMPKGQYEAAAAVGLGYWKTMRLIILPQALRIVIPGMVNSFISLFKDTSLVLIIGIFDLLGIVQQNFTDANWAAPSIPATGYAFCALIYWAFCFSMSRYSLYTERRLHTGHKR